MQRKSETVPTDTALKNQRRNEKKAVQSLLEGMQEPSLATGNKAAVQSEQHGPAPMQRRRTPAEKSDREQKRLPEPEKEETITASTAR